MDGKEMLRNTLPPESGITLELGPASGRKIEFFPFHAERPERCDISVKEFSLPLRGPRGAVRGFRITKIGE